MKSALRWLVALLLLSFVGRTLWNSTHDLARHAVWPEPRLLVLSFGTLGVFLGLAVEGWRRILAELGYTLTYRQAVSVLYLSNLAKYLPGGVWNMVGRVMLCERHGVPPLATSISLLMETACQVVGALLVSLFMLPGLNMVAPIWLGLAVLVIAVGVHPLSLNRVLALARRFSGRDLPDLPYRYGFVLAMLLYYACNWCLIGTAFALLGQSVLATALSWTQWGLLVGGFVLAWNAGLLAFFLPAGLGAREAILLLLLHQHFPEGWPALIALLGRVWLIIAEVIAFAIAGGLRNRTAQGEIRS